MTDLESSAQWREAVAGLGLGLPVASPTRHRLLKRLVARLGWPFLSRQITVNRALADAVHELAASLAVVSERADVLEARLLARQPEVDAVLSSLRETTEHHHAVLERHEKPLERHELLLVGIDLRLDDFASRVDDLGDFAIRVGEDLKVFEERIDFGQRQAFARYHDGVGLLRGQITDLGTDVDARIAAVGSLMAERLDAASHELEQLPDINDRLQSLVEQLSGLGADVLSVRTLSGRQFDQARAEAANGLARLDRVTRELRMWLANLERAVDSGTVQQVAATGSRPLDSTFARLYDGFVEAVEIPTAAMSHDELRKHLDDIKAIDLPGPVVDLGCAGGTWLDLLRVEEIPAYGLDARQAYVERCRARGLDVRDDDGLAHLAACAPGSLRAVTALRSLEYLDLDHVVRLVDAAFLALGAGGMLMVEALDPDNLRVAAGALHRDPERRGLLPKHLLQFLVEARGFVKVELRGVSHRLDERIQAPDPERMPWAPEITPLVAVLNEHLLGPEAYALVARRP